MELICCVCGKMKIDGHWVHSEIPEETLLSHGYCLTCMNEALIEIRRLRKKDDFGKAVA